MLAGFPAGKWHPAFCRLEGPIERSYKSPKFTQLQRRCFGIFLCVLAAIHFQLKLVFLSPIEELDAFFYKSIITLYCLNFISNLPFESTEFKVNCTRLRSTQWLGDRKMGSILAVSTITGFKVYFH